MAIHYTTQRTSQPQLSQVAELVDAKMFCVTKHVTDRETKSYRFKSCPDYKKYKL